MPAILHRHLRRLTPLTAEPEKRTPGTPGPPAELGWTCSIELPGGPVGPGVLSFSTELRRAEPVQRVFYQRLRHLLPEVGVAAEDDLSLAELHHAEPGRRRRLE